MKKIFYSLIAMAFISLSSCQDDEIDKQIEETQSGDGILFSTVLSEGLSTRTVYDDEPVDGYYRVSWETGDEIAVYCPQASNGTTLVDYTITPNPADRTVSEEVTSSGPGLKWGEDEVHHFYGFYPASAVTGEEDGKIRGRIPTTQNVERWDVTQNDEGGTTYYGVANTDYAYMWAYGSANRMTVSETEPVGLIFHPWMTVLDIEIPGPSQGAGKIVTNVNIRAIEGTQTMLAGDFYCDMNPVETGQEDGSPNYVPIGNEGTVNNTISISGYNSATDDFITLGPNDKMVVRAYLLPIDDQNSVNARNIQISVATLNGAALTRTLGYSNHGENSIQPHKINKVILPRLTETGTNYWMSTLDKDIYLSEISFPGSKNSYNTKENGANPVYQTATISQQFEDGVRAFTVPVDVKNIIYKGTRTGDRPSYNYSHEYVSSTLQINGASGVTISNTIEDIAAGLEKSELSKEQGGAGSNAHECAVVIITRPGNISEADVTFEGSWQDGLWAPSKFEQVGGSSTIWIEAVANELQKLSQETQNRIYGDEITANTTLEDVKGKIILKINYNEKTQEDVFAANDRYPMLFSIWNGLKSTTNLYWGTMAKEASLQWMYQEATHVGSAGEAGTPNTATIKLANVNEIFTSSIQSYQNNDAHSIWYMNDCGGVFTSSVVGTNGYDGSYASGEGNDYGVQQLTRWLNGEVRQTLQERDENATLGIVLFNYADKRSGSGQAYGTDELIQTVIDNNFKFNLRKEGGASNP